MNIESTKKAIEVMQAYVDGKTVIHKHNGALDGNHTSTVAANWGWNGEVDMYRIKPEPIERWIVFDEDDKASTSYLKCPVIIAEGQMVVHMREVTDEN